MKRWFASLSLVTLLLCVWPAMAWADLQGDIQAQLDAAKLGKTQVSITVADGGTGRTLAAIDSDELMIPASNMKLLTTATALGTLGPKFIFRTELRLISEDADGAVLLVKGDGDPAFGDPKLLGAYHLDVEKLLSLWVGAVQKAGIKKVARLIVDDRVFDRQRVNPDWPVRQLNAWYCAQVAGLSFYDNCLDVYPTPTSPGKPPLITIVPAAPFLKIQNHAATGGGDHFLISRHRGTNDLYVSGHVEHRPTDPINITVDDPPAFFGRVFADRLSRAAVTVAKISEPAEEDKFPAGKLLYAVQTTLPAVLGRCNKDSQNLFAECLLKRSGAKYSGKPGSWDNGKQAARAFLGKLLGADALVPIKIDDGSGMSRDNRVTSAFLVKLLSAMLRNKEHGPVYFHSLSIAGKDGTLENRLDHNLVGQVHGKTGYLRSVSSFTGYLVLPADTAKAASNAADTNAVPSGRIIVFSMLFNNFPSNLSVLKLKALQDQIMLRIDHELATATVR